MVRVLFRSFEFSSQNPFKTINLIKKRLTSNHQKITLQITTTLTLVELTLISVNWRKEWLRMKGTSMITSRISMSSIRISRKLRNFWKGLEKVMVIMKNHKMHLKANQGLPSILTLLRIFMERLIRINRLFRNWMINLRKWRKESLLMRRISLNSRKNHRQTSWLSIKKEDQDRTSKIQEIPINKLISWMDKLRILGKDLMFSIRSWQTIFSIQIRTLEISIIWRKSPMSLRNKTNRGRRKLKNLKNSSASCFKN